LADRIERAGLISAAAGALAAGLRSCRHRHRCGSAACPQCSRAEQVLLASVTEEFVRQRDSEFKFVFATIVPPKSVVPKEALRGFNLANFRRRVRDGLAKTSAHWAVGSIDFTLNEHRDELFAAHWSPHAHMIVATGDIDALAQGLRKAFPRSAAAPRPVLLKPLDGESRVFSYIFAADFARRISIEKTQRFDRRTGKVRSCRGTTYDRLRVAECVELALLLDAVGLGGRLLLRNARLYGTAAAFRLQPITG
jgi:hypothetical protein